jgi:glycosyltransferase involved in cell wall biosynthesis
MADRIRTLGPLDGIVAAFPADAAYLKVDAPVIVVHDATWRQLIDFYPEFERQSLARESLMQADRLEKDALANADRLLYFSQWAAKSAILDYGVDSAKVSVALPGANLACIPSRSEVAEAIRQRRDKKCRLLFVGKEWRRKGADISVEITRSLNAMGIPAKLDIVGCLPPKGAPSDSSVEVHGFLDKSVPREAAKLDRLLRAAHFLVMPARAECAGLVFCEAAAHGVPAIATDVGGIPEIVQSEFSGLTLSLDATPLDYARWIAGAYNSRAHYEALAWNARANFETKLNWPHFCAHIVTALSCH